MRIQTTPQIRRRLGADDLETLRIVLSDEYTLSLQLARTTGFRADRDVSAKLERGGVSLGYGTAGSPLGAAILALVDADAPVAFRPIPKADRGAA